MVVTADPLDRLDDEELFRPPPLLLLDDAARALVFAFLDELAFFEPPAFAAERFVEPPPEDPESASIFFTTERIVAATPLEGERFDDFDDLRDVEELRDPPPFAVDLEDLLAVLPDFVDLDVADRFDDERLALFAEDDFLLAELEPDFFFEAADLPDDALFFEAPDFFDEAAFPEPLRWLLAPDFFDDVDFFEDPGLPVDPDFFDDPDAAERPAVVEPPFEDADLLDAVARPEEPLFLPPAFFAPPLLRFDDEALLPPLPSTLPRSTSFEKRLRPSW